MIITVCGAICSLNPSAVVTVLGRDIDTCIITWHEDTPEISKEDIKVEQERLRVIEDNK